MPAYRLSSYGLLIRDERILLVRLGEKEPGKGLWTLPGGGFEKGESPEEAAVREIKEETNLRAALGPLVHAETTRRVLSNGIETYMCRFYFEVEDWEGTEGAETNGWTDAIEWHSLRDVENLPLADVVEIGLKARSERADNGS